MAIPAPIYRAMEIYVHEQGGDEKNVPHEAFERVWAAMLEMAHRDLLRTGERPDAPIVTSFTRNECAKIASRYPRRKPYAKKRAVR